jgi:hypothetical protein
MFFNSKNNDNTVIIGGNDMRYVLLLLLLPLNIFAATFSYSGDWRAELAMYHDLDLTKSMHGTPSADYLDPTNPLFNPNASNNTKTYWLQRFKIKPDLIIYDDVRIKTEWILLAGSALSSTSMGGSTNNMVAGGIMSGDNIHADLSVRRAWLEWVSDWGVFTLGRQPLHYGLGMTYNSGDGLWDYWGDSVDRLAYKLMMGTVWFGLAYDVRTEGAVNYYGDNKSSFETQIGYNELESNMEIGFMWHFDFGAGKERIHVYDVYQKKTFPETGISLGFEAAYRKGQERDYDADGIMDQVQAFGLLFDFLYAPGASEFGLKTGFATGEDGTADNKYHAFHFNRAYKIAMLLFNEDLGVGGDSVHGSPGIGADFNDLGAIFIAPRFAYTFSEVLKVESVIAYAMTQRKPPLGKKKSLGTEFDLNATYMWKDYFETGIRMGWFFPGPYFDGKAVGMGTMATFALKF